LVLRGLGEKGESKEFKDNKGILDHKDLLDPKEINDLLDQLDLKDNRAKDDLLDLKEIKESRLNTQILLLSSCKLLNDLKGIVEKRVNKEMFDLNDLLGQLDLNDQQEVDLGICLRQRILRELLIRNKLEAILMSTVRQRSQQN